MFKSIKVNPSNTDTRIDKWLKREFSNLNQSFIEKNLRKGLIKINNSKVKSNYIVSENDIINIFNFSIEKYPCKIKKKDTKKIPVTIINRFKKIIVYENKDFMIIDKWNGLASQAGSKVNISIDDIIKNISIDYNLVHRLDKDTSGLMIIAKNFMTTKIISKLFYEKKIKKIYLAICQGNPINVNSLIKLKIPIKKNKNVFGETVTRFKILKKNKNFSFIAFKPLTGKKHQLRILSKKIGCPIVGDNKYNLDKTFYKESLKLNAHILKFTINSKEYIFKSEIPINFNNFLIKEKLNYNKIKNLLKLF